MRKILPIIILHFLLYIFHFSPALAIDYTISVSVTGNGTVIPNKTTAARGDTIFLTVTPGVDCALLDIEARLAPSVSGGLNILAQSFKIDANHYAVIVTADTDVTATFVLLPYDEYGRLPYALYLADGTLLFYNTSESLAVGDIIRGSSIVALWSDIGITHTSTSSSSMSGWNATDEMDVPLYPYRRVIFDESFSTVRPQSFCNWFSVYDGGPTSIEGLQYLNTSEATSMSGMFWDCFLLSEIDVSHFDTRNVTNMAYMFSGCSALQTIDVSNFDTRKVKNIRSMFYECTSLERILCDDTWDTSASRQMFYDCPKLHGAVAWNLDEINSSMANPYTGYFSFSNGDLNADGAQDEIDVHLLAAMIANGAPVTRVSDINKDGLLSLSDLTALVNRLRQAPS